MHPAPSVIAFTTLSGLGFGFLAFLGLGQPDVYGWSAFAFYFIGYALSVGGLLFSVFHLGNKVNATKSFSQWRTSWLSREGVMAVATLLVVALHAIGRIFFDIALPTVGFIGSVMAIVTVFTTSMIYTQLKTVPRWHSPLTPVLFLGYAIAGGAILSGPPGQIALGMWILTLVGAIQIIAWIKGDGLFAAAGSTLETATGLGQIGKTRQLEPPHAGENYLLHEMAFRIGRKHALKLRVIGLFLAVAIPLFLYLALPANHVVGLLLVLIHIAGVMVIRWLFFAEAKHVVSLYYDR